MSSQNDLIFPSDRAPSVFVSYSREDREIVLLEVDFIKKLGCRVFVDDQINPGDAWIDRLANEINSCDVFLVFLTDSSINSRYVLDEIKYAARGKKKIIPFCFCDISLPPAIDLLIGSAQRLEKNKFSQDGYRETLRCSIWGGGQSGHMGANFSGHDKNMLREIGQLFNFDVIKRIEGDRFGAFVGDGVIHPVNNFIERSEDPLYKFKSDALEVMRLDALSKAKAFIWHFSQQSAGAHGGYVYINIEEFKKINSRVDEVYWKEYSRKTSELAVDFCRAISELRSELINC